ncbi:MAG: sugar ABC transporter permease [Anaerolineae bacterium]|nr:sugar ABC transporter permease [Anaerolineae bacterium]
MRSKWTGWLLLSPTLIILFLVGLLPFFYMLYVGFNNWNPNAVQKFMSFAGADNYRALVFDGEFWNSIGVTLRFTFFAVLSELVLGFILAQALMRDFPGKSLFRIVHTVPLMVAPLVVGAIWRLLTIPGLGPLPYFFQNWFGLDYKISQYSDQAFITTVIMDIWHWTPFVTLTMLAGLSSLPKEPLEQAQVDGANRWQVFRHITIPMIQPLILTTVFIRVMDAMRIMDEAYMLTGGGPGTTTQFIGIRIFRVVFPKTDYGYGAAVSLVTLYFTTVICWMLYTGIVSRRERKVLPEGT